MTGGVVLSDLLWMGDLLFWGSSPHCWWHKSFMSEQLYQKLNKLVNADLKHLANWLNANKISLNVKKT